MKSCLIFVRQVTAEVELSRAVAPLAEVLAADGPSTALEELLHKDHRQSSPASAQALLEVGLGEQLRESLLVQVEDCVQPDYRNGKDRNRRRHQLELWTGELEEAL